jgi:MFS family permease
MCLVNQRKIEDKKRMAINFILLMGLISLLGDIVYEGARGIYGPYLASIGFSAFLVGLVTGAGEFLGYFLRLVSGYIADRTRNYWFLTFIGYSLVLSIPLLMFANTWKIAAILIISERLGKGIRTPARDAILSYATKKVGRGFGFGLHEAMDQIGAITGPVILFIILSSGGGFRESFGFLFIPSVFLIVLLLMAMKSYPEPHKMEIGSTSSQGSSFDSYQASTTSLSGKFWYYTLFSFLAVSGFAGFPIIAYHLKTISVTDSFILLIYAIAMGVDAIVGLISGRMYDRTGLKILYSVPLLTLFIPFSFTGKLELAILGILFWGAVMGMHETVMRAAIADFTGIAKRGTAYGIFNTVYGLGWLFGSSVIGFLYGSSALLIPVFVVIMEISALLVLWAGRKKE